MPVPSILKSFKLLSDPTRVRIFLLLERHELTVAELQEILGMGQSRISAHLAQMKGSGILVNRRAGKNVYYGVVRGEGADRIRELVREAAGELAEAGADQAALMLTMKKREDRARTYFDQIAGRFGRTYCPGRSWEAVAHALFRLVPRVVVADLGAGEGMLAQLLAKRAERVIAVDSSENMVAYGADLAKRHGVMNLEYRLGDVGDPPIGDGEVDIAIFSQALHHAASPQTALGHAYRILRPGGRILILDLVAHHFEEARELYADLWLGFSEADLNAMLSGAKFTGVETAVLPKESEPPHFQPIVASAERPVEE